MRLGSALVTVAVLAAACGGDTAATRTTESTAGTTGTQTTTAASVTTAPSAPTTLDAGTTTPAAIDEEGPIFLVSDLSFGDESMVVIRNGGEPGSLAGYFLCQRPNYHALEDVVIPEGGFFAIGTGGSVFNAPVDAVVATETADIGLLNAAGGEVALYSSSDFSSSSDIRSYVEWGSAGHPRSQVAVAAGIWEGFVPTTDSSTGISAFALPAFGPGDWVVLGP